eukprot:790677-Amphidinium_carterae.1
MLGKWGWGGSKKFTCFQILGPEGRACALDGCVAQVSLKLRHLHRLKPQRLPCAYVNNSYSPNSIGTRKPLKR